MTESRSAARAGYRSVTRCCVRAQRVVYTVERHVGMQMRLSRKQEEGTSGSTIGAVTNLRQYDGGRDEAEKIERGFEHLRVLSLLCVVKLRAAC